ncbi:NADPH:quinone oxidoreductase family protein [Reichenbachiella ulvae]|uniref:NADPH:quinone oxidoreductase family protein n=1 Tax=Reichenbachiella ulvae TaxID=2980104 RepID=A0ABT3CNP8_9BACT|nr:NADPH:quinone oxidoreductase family protein [Reichenbachiella ulvae]MCV9385222.1 NADPH:quinone oxidoreductase family protein [Reichenbachiella ulvae]
MKAVLCKSFGGPENLVIEEVEDLTPEEGQVIISVKAAGLNFPDTLIIQGKYQFQPDLPFSPGGEVAGVVKSVGTGVEGLKPGDRVMSGTSWGGLAEEVRARASNTFIIPEQMSYEQAAASLMTYATSIHALKDRGQLKAGETVMVLGAGGGIGVASIQLAKLMGAKVIACASTDEKLDFCRSIGADHTINYKKEDLKSRAKEITDGQGVDVIVDPVGGDYAEAAFRSIARFGRYLVVGFASGQIPRLPFNLPLLKSASIVGVFWGSLFRNDVNQNRENVAQLLEWFESGELESVIYHSYPLDQYEAAMKALLNQEVKGKIVLIA